MRPVNFKGDSALNGLEREINEAPVFVEVGVFNSGVRS